jgi:hypothetical protein
VTPPESRAQSASSSGALARGLAGTDEELDFRQYSFHHIMQVVRVCSFSTFALPPALPPCCCPLAFRRQVRRLTSRMSSESSPGYPECVVSCHGAGRLANSIRPFLLHLGHLSDHLVRLEQKRRGERETQGLSGLEIDH